jgi:hypothetical protein
MPNFLAYVRLTLAQRESLRESLLCFTTYTKPDYQANWHQRPLAAIPDDHARRAQAGADPAVEPVRDQSRVAVPRRLARLPLAGRSAHGLPFAEHDDGPDALEMCTRLPLEVLR